MQSITTIGSLMESATAQLRSGLDNARLDAETADADVLLAVAAVRRSLGEVERHIGLGYRLPGSVMGVPHAEGAMDDLTRAMRSRQSAYDNVAVREGILKQFS